LAPLPDEPEIIEGEGDGDDDMDQDEPTAAAEAEPDAALLEPPSREDDDLDPATSEDPQQTPLSLSLPSRVSPNLSDTLALQGTLPDDDLDVAATFAASLEEVDEATAQALQDLPEGDLTGLEDDDMAGVVGVGMEGLEGLDMTGLGPDGTQFENEGDLTQIQEGDLLLGGGEVMDEIGDPFDLNTRQ